MDARSIAATALRGGVLTAATELEPRPIPPVSYDFDRSVYRRRIYAGFGQADPEANLKYGPNITDWPEMRALPNDLILKLAAVITDPVTTTDELIPSGETSSYRSNPLKLAEFTLSRKDPDYVPKAKAFARLERNAALGRRAGSFGGTGPLMAAARVTGRPWRFDHRDRTGSALFAVKPGMVPRGNRPPLAKRS